MKVLIFTHIFPYPLNEGGKVAQFGFLEYLCKENDVVLVTVNNYEGLSKDAEALNKIIPSLEIELLTVEKPVERTGITAFLLKMVDKIDWRLKRRLSLKYPKPLKIADNNFFIKPVHIKNPEVVEQFLEVVKREKPDLVQIDFINNADLVNILPPGLPKILIHHDLRFASIAQATLLEGESEQYSEYLTGYVSTIEAAFLNKFTTVITFSMDDCKRLRPLTNEGKVAAIPFPVLDKNIMEVDDRPYTINKLIFIGPEYHPPNFDAIKWYMESMANLIFTKFKLKLVVVGNWSAATVDRFSKMEGIEFAGFVAEIKEIARNSVMLVPLRIGSGIRTKLLDAFAFGIPVISTTLGCEGLGTENERELFIADNAEQFIGSIEKLLQNQVLVRNMRHNANSFVRNNYSQQSIFDKRMSVYKQSLNSELI